MQVEEILNFWFGDLQTEAGSYEKRRKLWFNKNPKFDQEIRTRFLSVYHQAVAGELNHWQSDPLSCLALILLFDQVPRNIFRNTPQAFATDSQALALAKGAIAQGFDQQLYPMQRIFIYLPFEHSEKLEDQLQSVHLAHQLHTTNPEFSDILDYAIRHLEVIERFGRFPHRNKILSRVNTPAEAKFLEQPASSF
jgi:uncharacterized protein (DUF924 family)